MFTHIKGLPMEMTMGSASRPSGLSDTSIYTLQKQPWGSETSSYDENCSFLDLSEGAGNMHKKLIEISSMNCWCWVCSSYGGLKSVYGKMARATVAPRLWSRSKSFMSPFKSAS